MLKQVLIFAVLVLLCSLVSAGNGGCCDMGRCRCCETQKAPCCDWGSLFRCLGKAMPAYGLPVAAATTLSDDQKDVLEFDDPESLFVKTLEANTERMAYMEEQFNDQLDGGGGGGGGYYPQNNAPVEPPVATLTCYVQCSDFALAFGSDGIPVCSQCSHTIVHSYVAYNEFTHQPERCIDLDFVRDMVTAGDNTLLDEFRAQCQANSCSCQATQTVANSLVGNGFISPRTYLYDPYGECTSYKCRVMQDGFQDYLVAY